MQGIMSKVAYKMKKVNKDLTNYSIMQKWKVYTHENAHDQLNNLSYTQMSNLMLSTNKTKWEMGNVS